MRENSGPALLALAMIVVPLLAACGEQRLELEQRVFIETRQSLAVIGLEPEDLELPKIGNHRVSEPARLAVVNDMLAQPLAMIDTTQRLANIAAGKPSAVVSEALELLGIPAQHRPEAGADSVAVEDIWLEMHRLADSGLPDASVPREWGQNNRFFASLRRVLHAAVAARRAYSSAGAKVGASELEVISSHLNGIISSDIDRDSTRRLLLDEYHVIGERIDLAGLANGLMGLLSEVERAIPGLGTAPPDTGPLEWQTPLGRVRISGIGDDVHSGEFLLLVDLGGNDRYEDVGSAVSPGVVSVVIDLQGNDRYHWQRVTGPGAAVLGMSLWVDADGDDHYEGRNVGLGAGLFGAGMLWDMKGDDVYKAGSMVMGSGRYGLGVLFDGNGDDEYETQLDGQGFGGTGGIGIHMDIAGDDSYRCGGYFKDQVEARIERHGSVHYAGMCQGFGFGRRPDVSGGVGLLLDKAGNDSYVADMFAQGAAYWFGLGMLVDRAGNDRYEAYEHCQGESLHLSAAILSDWQGDDRYYGYEHAQGVGIDRAAGILYDHSGNDRYRSHNKSQGSGIKPYGLGLLIDNKGDDYYEAVERSQGYVSRPVEFPEEFWPTGILLDLGGRDQFVQSGISGPGKGTYRIQNRQGIAVNK